MQRIGRFPEDFVFGASSPNRETRSQAFCKKACEAKPSQFHAVHGTFSQAFCKKALGV